MRHKIFPLLLLCLSMAANGLMAQVYKSSRTLTGHTGEVQNIRFSPDGKMLASGGEYGDIILWDATTGSIIHKIMGHANRINEVSFDPTGKMLVSASYDGSAKVWDTKTGALLGTYYNYDFVTAGLGSKLVAFACFSADSKYVYFAGDGGAIVRGKLGKDASGNDYRAERLFSLVTEDLFGRKSSSRVTGGALSYDGNCILVSIKNFVYAVDVKTGTLTRTFIYPTHWLNDVILGAKSTQISTWSEDGNVTIWDYATAKIVKKIKAGDMNDYSAAAFNKEGTLMVTGVSGINANVWNVETGEKIATLSGHTQKVRLARFSPADNFVATASYDGTIKIWKVEEPKEEPVIEPEPEKPIPIKIVPLDSVAKKEALPVEKEGEDFPPKKAEEDIEEGKLEVGKTFNLKSIQFEQGDHTLLDGSYPELQKVAALLKKHPNMIIQLEGHTDNVGDPRKNMTLSHRRVVMVKNYLVDTGIAESRILIKAFGQERPIAENGNEATRKLNRRVELRVIKM